MTKYNKTLMVLEGMLLLAAPALAHHAGLRITGLSSEVEHVLAGAMPRELAGGTCRTPLGPACEACLHPTCGNGHVDTGEECDDGNQIDGDGCSSACRVEDPCSYVCGNGKKEGDEECDDGNHENGDGCSSSCKKEVCGNGRIDAGEQCDDGRNSDDSDGCDDYCMYTSCDCGTTTTTTTTTSTTTTPTTTTTTTTPMTTTTTTSSTTTKGTTTQHPGNLDSVCLIDGNRDAADEVCYDLYAGNPRLDGSNNPTSGVVTGNVCVRVDGDNLAITYTTNNEPADNNCWELDETHLWVGGDPDSYPSKSNNRYNPRTGRFPFKDSHDCGIHVVTYTVPIYKSCEGPYPADDTVFYLMAHAKVEKCAGCTGLIDDGETAWSLGNRINPNPRGSWAMQSEFTLSCTCT